MEHPSDGLESPRVLWAAAVTIAAAVAAVLGVREVAVRVLHPDPAYEPLAMGPPILDTILCTVAAVVVFLNVIYDPNPLRKWNRVAAIALIVSFLPDVYLATSHAMRGGWPEACALMAMHVVVWALCVTLLPALAIAKRPRKTEAPDRPLSIL